MRSVLGSILSLAIALLFSWPWIFGTVHAQSATGDLYVSYYGSGRGILKISTSGTITQVTSGGFVNPAGLAFDSAGNLYLADNAYPNFGAGSIYRIASDGSRTVFASGFNPAGLAFDSSDNLFVSDTFSHQIYRYSENGTARTVVASLVYDLAIVIDANGNLFGGDNYADTGDWYRIDKYAPDGTASVFANDVGYVIGMAFDPLGNLYLTSGTPNGTTIPNRILKILPDGSQSVFTSQGFSSPSGIAVDSEGNIYAADQQLCLIYKFTPDGTRSVFAQMPQGLHPQALAFSHNAQQYKVSLLYDATKPVKSGSTLPIKLQLLGMSGNNVSSSSITLHAINVTQVSTSITGSVQDAGNANPDDDFRFDSTIGGGEYIFNLSTKGLPTGTYNLNFVVTGDSSVYTAPFQVR
jgi:sugar lactone lactonase YvrE